MWLPVPWGLCTLPGPTSTSQTEFPQVQSAEAYLGYNSSRSDTGGSPGGSHEESACNAGDPGWFPGSGRPPGGGNGNPPQYPCLENPMDGGAWQTTVCGVRKSHVGHDLQQQQRLREISNGLLFPLTEGKSLNLQQRQEQPSPLMIVESAGPRDLWFFLRLHFHGFVSIRGLNFSSYVRWILT